MTEDSARRLGAEVIRYLVHKPEELARRAPEMGDRVLKGTKPGAIPVEQADEFDLAINGRTARILAIKIPESVLARATRIIE